LTALGAFVAAGLALVVLQRGEEDYVEQAQREPHGLFARSQAELSSQNEQAAGASLLALHEASHATLTGVAASLPWGGKIAPFVARAQSVSAAERLALPKGDVGRGPTRRARGASASPRRASASARCRVLPSWIPGRSPPCAAPASSRSRSGTSAG
jgi:hypothetical protein